MRFVVLVLLCCSVLQGCVESEGEESVTEKIDISDRDLRVVVAQTLLQEMPLCEGQSMNCFDAIDSGDNAALEVCADEYAFCKDYPSVHFFPRRDDHDSLYGLLDLRYGPIAPPDNASLHIVLHPSSRPEIMRLGRVLVGDSGARVTTEFTADTALFMGSPQQHTLMPGENIMIVQIAPQYPEGTYTLVVRREGEVVYEGEVER